MQQTPTPPHPSGAAARPPRVDLNLAELPDDELVTLARGGHRQAFDALIERHHGAVYAVALARLRRRESAEDLAQEVFLRAWLHLTRLTAPALFARWVVRMARNLALDWLRRGTTRSRLLPMLSLDAETMAEPTDPNAPRPDAGLLERERQAVLDRALSSLPDDLRELVLLHFSAGLGQSEIARRLGVNPSTIGRRLERALGLLRTAMAVAEALPAAPETGGQAPPRLPRSGSALGGQFSPDVLRGQLAPRPAAAVRAVAVIGAAAALGESAKAALVASAAEGSAATAAATAMPLTTSAWLGQTLASLPAALAGGVQSMGIFKTIAAIGAAAALTTGGFMLTHGDTPAPAPASVTPSATDPLSVDMKSYQLGDEAISFIPTGKTMKVKLENGMDGIDRVELTAQADGNCLIRLMAKDKERQQFLLGPGQDRRIPRLRLAPGMMFNLQIVPAEDLLLLESAYCLPKPGGIEIRWLAKVRPDLLPRVGAITARMRSGQISRVQMMKEIADLFEAEGMLPSDARQRALTREGILNAAIPL